MSLVKVPVMINSRIETILVNFDFIITVKDEGTFRAIQFSKPVLGLHVVSTTYTLDELENLSTWLRR